SVGTLLKADAALLQAQGQPVVLIETDARREGEIGTDPHKHLTPTGVLDVEVVLFHPASLHFQMPTLVFPDGGHDGSGFAGFDDGHHLIGLGTPEVAIHEIITSSRRIFLNGYSPFLRTVFGPVVVLRGDVAQYLPTHGIDLAIAPEKAHGALFLLERLDHGVQQDTIESTIGETDVILMVFVKGVHGSSRGVRSLEHTPLNASLFYACPQNSGTNLSGSRGVAQGARVGVSGVLVHSGLSEAGNLRLGVANATGYGLRPCQHRGRISSAWKS